MCLPIRRLKVRKAEEKMKSKKRCEYVKIKYSICKCGHNFEDHYEIFRGGAACDFCLCEGLKFDCYKYIYGPRKGRKEK